jgi:hypothetical protein
MVAAPVSSTTTTVLHTAVRQNHPATYVVAVLLVLLGVFLRRRRFRR